MIKIKTFLMALFIVPLLCGSALCEENAAKGGNSGGSSAPANSSSSSESSKSSITRMDSRPAGPITSTYLDNGYAGELRPRDTTVSSSKAAPKDFKEFSAKAAEQYTKNMEALHPNDDKNNGNKESAEVKKDPEVKDGTEVKKDPEVKDGTEVKKDPEVEDGTEVKEDNEGDGKGADIAKKAIEAVSSAAMGIGAMQMAQGLSEQKADKEAEADMRQYLNTFTCTYGAKAQTVKFGPEDVTLDAGADLVKYATEYRGLAERLKKTKKALNLTPGIEEEEIIDPATSGLYSYTPTEKKDGQYTSLSKAILDEESEDAKEWAAQKSKSKKRVIGGAVALGAGTALSVLNGSGALDKLFSRHNKNGEESETSDVPEEYQEPQNCSFEKCLGMLSVTEDTERTELYSQMKNFCDKNYPNEPDCVKVMLIYQMSHFIIEEMDSADNYDFDHYKDSDLIFYCDSNVCVDSPEERYLHLFTDN